MATPSPDPTAPRFARLRHVARGLQLDRAVLYILVLRLWQLLAGPVTVLLIVRYFSPEMQGFYYAFGSLLAFQTLFDLNVTVVLLVGAGREWIALDLDSHGRVTGESTAAEQLASLARFGTVWYRGAAALCLLFVGGAGFLIFRQQGLGASDQLAWGVTILAASLILTLLPRMAILQGCHQILAVNRNLALQSICGSLVVWTCLVVGLGLWAVPCAWLVRLGWDVWLVHGRFGPLFASLRHRTAHAINWKADLWPLQWRLAVQSIASAVATASFVLSLFIMHSEAAAGRIGMTFSVLHMLLWGGLAWLQTRVPKLSGLAKHEERGQYDRLFIRITLLTTAAVLSGALAGWFVILGLDYFDIHVGEVRLADRFVSPISFALMAIAIIAQHIINCLTTYSRTRQREAFVLPNVILNGGLTAGIWLAAGPYGEFGVALVAATALVVGGLPIWLMIWRRERRTW